MLKADSGLEAKYRGQAVMLANRVRKRFQHLRKRFTREHIDVFRLYDWDIPEIRAVVDWYAGHLVVGEYTREQSTPEWLPMMGRAVAEAMGVPPDRLHLKERFYGHADGRRYRRIDYTNQLIEVRERDLKFYVNPWDYVDTGLFADHRDTRQMVRKMAQGKDFLNLFCYTGAFTCYAIRGGARTSVSVDRSKTAIGWAGKNFALNGMGSKDHRLIQAHAFDFLAKAHRRRQRFDLAVVDPPSFYTIRSREDRFDIAREHPILLQAVRRIMRQGATIFFSTNHQNFVPAMEDLPVTRLEDITTKTIPEDYVNKRKTIHRCWRITV
ncbi:MAG: class I SAM-dependent methyltransferase [Desulfobacteraceae bacterium]|jgi:23S rRNA (cytosine1962-C5)-methyltransferase